MLNNTNKTIIYSMLFVLSKIVFMHKQTPDTKFGTFIWRTCRLLRLWRPS